MIFDVFLLSITISCLVYLFPEDLVCLLPFSTICFLCFYFVLFLISVKHLLITTLDMFVLMDGHVQVHREKTDLMQALKNIVV